MKKINYDKFYTNAESLTGATVIIPDNGADIGIDVRGSDTGTMKR